MGDAVAPIGPRACSALPRMSHGSLRRRLLKIECASASSAALGADCEDNRPLTDATDHGEPMDIREYLNAVRKRWYLVVLCIALGGAWGLYEGATTPPEYRATSQAFVSVSGGSSTAELVQGS